MREYAKVSPQFWIGETGKKIREFGRDAQVLALYLLTCPSSNMIGLYYLPMPTLCHETGLDEEGASKGLRSLLEGGFAGYDQKSETVFVFEMARHQIGPSLKFNDLKVKGVKNCLSSVGKSTFFEDFINKYGVAYHVQNMKPLRSPLQAPSKQGEGEGVFPQPQSGGGIRFEAVRSNRRGKIVAR